MISPWREPTLSARYRDYEYKICSQSLPNNQEKHQRRINYDPKRGRHIQVIAQRQRFYKSRYDPGITTEAAYMVLHELFAAIVNAILVCQIQKIVHSSGKGINCNNNLT